jgi:hypothetical protein
MFSRVTLLAFFSMLFLGLVGCSAPPPPADQAEETEAAQAPAPVEEVPLYELTRDDITTHPDWTSRNITILGAKLGDRTRDVEKNFGALDNTRTLTDDYLTIYQKQGLFVYTQKLTGKARQFEVNQTMADQVKDAKLKRLLTGGDLNYMREILGMEEGVTENADENATEYNYDSRGFRFVKFKVGNQTLNALRFTEIKKTTT